MEITKFGHSCLLVVIDGVRILLDPGEYSTEQNSLTDLDAVLITHEHRDHLSMESLKEVMKNNLNVKIYTNGSVKAILEKEGVESELIVHGQTLMVNGVSLEGVGKKHAVVVNSIPPAENVGFLIGGRLFYPGDALTLPGKVIEVLALPTAAPWAKMSEIVDYAISVKPHVAFPVHDAILSSPEMMQGLLMKVLQEAEIEFKPVEIGVTYPF
jgi:L-ascorbate metabolism protein UlaG (beta-lactamase superfamily)